MAVFSIHIFWKPTCVSSLESTLWLHKLGIVHEDQSAIQVTILASDIFNRVFSSQSTDPSSNDFPPPQITSYRQEWHLPKEQKAQACNEDKMKSDTDACYSISPADWLAFQQGRVPSPLERALIGQPACPHISDLYALPQWPTAWILHWMPTEPGLQLIHITNQTHGPEELKKNSLLTWWMR